MEEWRPVVGFEGHYEVSSHGRVRSLDRTLTYGRGRTRKYAGRIMKTPQSTCGHPVVSLSKGGRCWTAYVHRLVLDAFEGPRPPNHRIRRLDGDLLNNRPGNLLWVPFRNVGA